MTWIMYELALNLDWQAKVQQEVDEVGMKKKNFSSKFFFFPRSWETLSFPPGNKYPKLKFSIG